MEKLDLKKQWKSLYTAKAGKDVVVDIPPIPYLMIDGMGDPNTSQSYQEAIEALFSLSYTLKFAIKKSKSAIDYAVMPLESLWWADDPRVFHSSDKSSWKWTAIIAQPEFISSPDVERACAELRKKKSLPALDHVRFEVFTEGPSVQTLYIGPYANEGQTIQRMHDFIRASGGKLRGKHHEIYLSDMRRTVPEKLKTIIRQPTE